MFGYATPGDAGADADADPDRAHASRTGSSEVRKAERGPATCGPDGKTQVTVRYENGRPVEIVKLLISTQHMPDIDGETLIKPDLWEHVVEPVLHEEYKELFTERELYESFLVNPTGKFEIGGPMGDSGLTGRKIIVDTYGGAARHGGGCFSGKDPSKVDRSAAYAARHVAKNVVAAGLADRCEVQVAYAIGVAHPVSLMVETFGTGRLPGRELTRIVDGAVRPPPRGDRPGPRPAPADLPEDRRLRAFRPRRPRLHLGAHRSSRRPAAAAGPPGATRRAARGSADRAPRPRLIARPPRPVAVACVARSTCSTTSVGVCDADEDEVEVVARPRCRSRRRRPGAARCRTDWS